MANQVTDAEITQIAQEYSIPPAILLGIVRSQGASPAFNIPSATLGAYSLSGSDVRDNPLLALTVAARTIAQSFSQTGSWEQALSTYLTGDPNAGSSPTSSVGGDIASILGQASVNASFGMSGYTPISISTFQTGANAFTQYQTGLVGQGGVVTHQSVNAWHQAATVAWSGGNKPGASANMEQVAEDILTAAKLPVTDANVAVITTMARGEGMNPSTNNWLATTTPEPGSGTFNSVGVQTFPSYAEGVDATARTLLNGNYKGMVALMTKGADLKTIASNPEVQGNLRKWQGGSSEDVNLLAHEANVPGKAPPKPKPEETPPPDPSRVGEFASQLQGAQIDPRAFAQYFGPFAAQRRRLLGSKRTDVSDYATMQQSLQGQGVPVTNAGIIAHLRGEPHPTYPNVTVGAFHDTQDKALIHSMNHMQQYPADGEVAKLVGMDNRQLSEYYMQKAQQKAASTAGPGVDASQKPDNVVPMPQQRGLAGGGGFTG